MKVGKVLFSLLLTVLIVLILRYLFFSSKDLFDKNNSNFGNHNESVPEEQFTEVTQFFAAVTSFSNERNEITLTELKTGKLLIRKDKEADTKKVLRIVNGDFEFLSKEEIIQKLLNQENEIAILPLTDIDFRLKTLKIDGLDIWDKNTDSKKYPLQIVARLSKKEYAEVFTFNPQKLNRITAAGEIIMARGVAERIEKYHDVLYPFRKIKDLFTNSDLQIATLEIPFSSSCNYCDSCMVFCAKPEYFEGLNYMGFDGVSLAANHIKDYGEEGIMETIELLDQNQILHTGAGINIDKARQPWIKEINGIKFGFLGYNDVVPTTYAATENSSGSAWANIDEIVTDIKALKPQVDVVVIFAHWGIEYTNIPSERQKEIAHTAIDAGADLIIGDHPHWVQGVEIYHDKFITYGIGNFVFDQMWSEETRQGSIMDFDFYENRLVSIAIKPTVIDDYAQPRLANETEGKTILNRIWEGSSF